MAEKLIINLDETCRRNSEERVRCEMGTLVEKPEAFSSDTSAREENGRISTCV